MYSYWRELEEVLLSIQSKCNIVLIEKDKCVQDQDKIYLLNGSIMLDQNQIAIIIDIYQEGLQILKKYNKFRCLCYSLYRLSWQSNYKEYKIYTNMIETLEKYLKKKDFVSNYYLPGIQEINQIVSGLIIINESNIEDIYYLKHLDESCINQSDDSNESEEIEEKFIQEYEQEQEQIIPQSVKQNEYIQKSYSNNNQEENFSELEVKKSIEEKSDQNYKKSFQELDEVFCDEEYQQNNLEKFYQKEYYVTQLDMSIKREQEQNNQDQNLKKRKLKETDHENLLDLEKLEYIGKENHKKLKVSENEVHSNHNHTNIYDLQSYKQLPLLSQDCSKKRFDNLIKKIYPKRDFKFNSGISAKEKREDYFERLDKMLKQLNLNVHFKSIEIYFGFGFECECIDYDICKFSPDLDRFVFNYRGSKRIKVDKIKLTEGSFIIGIESQNIQVNSDFPLIIKDDYCSVDINCKQSVTLLEYQEYERTFSYIKAPIIITKNDYFEIYFEAYFDSINEFYEQFYDTDKIYLLESYESQRIEALDQKLQCLMAIVVFEDPILDFCLTYPIQYLLIDLYLD